MRYLFVVPVWAHPLDDRTFAIESAFARHLEELLGLISPPFDEIVVAGPRMSREDYEANRSHLAVLNADRDRIAFSPLYDAEQSRPSFWRSYPRILRELTRLVSSSEVVHASPTHDLWHPTELPALICGAALGKRTISVTDLDRRDDARLNYELGQWSRRSYLLTRYLYDPIRHLQHELVVRMCSLVLFKGDRLEADYGPDRDNVRTFFDPGFAIEDVVGVARARAKAEALVRTTEPLRVLYFGRLVPYKGVDRMIEAIAHARRLGRDDVRFTILGAGEQERALRELVRARALGDQVRFVEPIRYGPEFFDALRPHHLMLAAPLTVDTPRSTWDAIASGVPLLAFDTEFYRGIGEATGVVETVPFLDHEAMGERIAHYAAHPEELVPRFERAVEAARANTSESWLRRRVEWTRRLFSDEPTGWGALSDRAAAPAEDPGRAELTGGRREELPRLAGAFAAGR